MKKQYDVIIIGAGIAGLTNAALLSKAGFSCCVIEKEPVVGGCIQGFKRKGFEFDTAIHWLNQCGEDGMGTRVFQLIGTDYPRTVEMKNIFRYKSKNTDYLLTNKPDELKEELIKDFPHEEKGIRKLFRVAKKIGKASERFKFMIRTKESMSIVERIIFSLNSFITIIPMIPYAMYDGDKGIKKGLNKYFFKDERLHKLYSSEKDLLSCIFPIAWAYVNDYQIPITGGAKNYTLWLKYVTEHFNNDVITKATVNKITFNDKTATGVIFTKDGKEQSISSKYVIAACDVETLYKKMLPKEIVSNKFLSKLDNAILYASGVSISIALDCPAREIGINDENISITREDVPRENHETGDPLTSAMFVSAPSERDETLVPEGKGDIHIYVLGRVEYNNYWQTDGFKNGEYIRGEKYKKHKEEYTKIVIDRVEKELGIDIQSHILFTDTATPITYIRYTGNKDGSIMGARPGRANMQAKIAHYKTPINNLFLSGHWAELGGGVPIAAQTALNSTLLILQKENKNLFKILAKYSDGKITIDEVLNSELLKKYNNSWKQVPTSNENKD